MFSLQANVRANCGLRQRGDLGQGHCGFAMTVDQAGAAFFKGQSLTLDTMMIGRSEELDFTSTAAFGIVGVVVERPLLHSLWERMYQRPAAAWLAQQVVVAVQPGMRAAVRALHMEALQRVAERPELLQQADAARALRDAVLMQWLEAIPERVGLTDTKGLRQRRQVVERACEVMLDQPDAPKTMLAVCAEIGVSPRKLEYCFRDVLGLSPNKYLRALRLNGVRRELKRSSRNDAAVQDIAARWGFWHLGDFSADYKRHFDELPSQTLRVPGRSVTARG